MYCKILYLCFIYGAILPISLATKKRFTEETKQTVQDDIKLEQTPESLKTEKQIFEKPLQKGKILIFHNAGTRSHLIVMNALSEGLVKQGHQVTSVIYAKSNIANNNYKEILIEDK